jgi:uncharacterized protein YecT (DUF1311 family)
MNRNYLTVVLLAASLLISFSATGRAEEKPEVLYTSPSGAIRIERSGENAWVVSTKDPTQRAKMPPLEGSSPVDDEDHSSPNDQWIFGTRRMAHGFSNGDLFHRVGAEHIELIPAEKDKEFNDLVWPYCVKQGALKANYSMEEDGADTALTDFIAWSLDSSRLLVELRGGNHQETLHHCYVYFNTRTKSFEMTDYLRKLNKSKSAVAACAEPTDPLPGEAELKVRLDALDQQLNKKYGEVLAHAGAGVPLVREGQHKWIKRRDEGARLYVSLFPQAERERRRLQFLGDVTAARIDTPTEEWENS